MCGPYCPTLPLIGPMLLSIDLALPHTAPHRPAPPNIAPHCPTLSNSVPHCPTLFHIAPHCPTLPCTVPLPRTASHCPAPHHTAPHRLTLPHTAPHCPTLPLRALAAPHRTLPPYAIHFSPLDNYAKLCLQLDRPITLPFVGRPKSNLVILFMSHFVLRSNMAWVCTLHCIAAETQRNARLFFKNTRGAYLLCVAHRLIATHICSFPSHAAHICSAWRTHC